MQLHRLSNRLANLAANYTTQGDLGPNSKAEMLEAKDYLTLTGLSMTAQLFAENDNKEGVDLNPTPGEVRFTAASLNNMDASTRSPLKALEEDLVGSFAMENSADGRMKSVDLEFESFSSEHNAVKLCMTQDGAQIVALEDQGETFKATAMRFARDESDNQKLTRTGSWAELPDSPSFGR